MPRQQSRKEFCRKYCHVQLFSDERPVRRSLGEDGLLFAASNAVAAEQQRADQRDILALWDCLSVIFTNEVEEHKASGAAKPLTLLDLFFMPSYDMRVVDERADEEAGADADAGPRANPRPRHAYRPFGLAKKLMWLACVAGELEVVEEIIRWHHKYMEVRPSSQVDKGLTPSQVNRAHMRTHVRAYFNHAWNSASHPLHAPDHKGRTALHFAVTGGHLRIVEVLVAEGVDLLASKRPPRHKTWARVVFLIVFASPHVRPMGVHHTCGKVNEIELTATHSVLNGVWSNWLVRRARRGTRRCCTSRPGTTTPP